MSKAAAPDPRVTKRRVTMRNPRIDGVNEDGTPHVVLDTATDYVRPDYLDEYVADARTRWQLVEVSPEPDAGPGGYDGATHVPDTLEHPLAGQTFAATTEA